ncbi:MAG: GHMP kinase [Candidatus Bathyarchaeota archaeon]|nr:GHMP kinase [Candidatus Bathyarchaeota archaeon]
MHDSIVISCPGRADFLNTHQDYKGLPVVPVAINLRTYLYAKPLKENMFTIKSLDLEQYKEPSTDTFEIKENDTLGGKFFGNYFRSIVNVIVRQGLIKKIRGMEITVKSEIPIGSGLASSAALEVAFAELLNHVCNLGYTRRDLAEIGYTAETKEVGVPCGRLDQYGVSFGGIIKLECRPPYRVETLPFTDLTFAIVDSGIRHATGDIHPKRQAEMNMGLESLMRSEAVPQELKKKLGYRFDQARWDEISEEEIEESLSALDDKTRNRIVFTIKMQRLTEFALKVLRFESVNKEEIIRNLGEEKWRLIQESPENECNYRVLGEVMNEQHSFLRDLYDVSLPEIEEICSAALEAGAYGAKISGAGMGGSIIALVRDNNVGQNVIDVCLAARAKKGWVSQVGEGVKIENPTSGGN